MNLSSCYFFITTVIILSWAIYQAVSYNHSRILLSFVAIGFLLVSQVIGQVIVPLLLKKYK